MYYEHALKLPWTRRISAIFITSAMCSWLVRYVQALARLLPRASPKAASNRHRSAGRRASATALLSESQDTPSSRTISHSVRFCLHTPSLPHTATALLYVPGHESPRSTLALPPSAFVIAGGGRKTPTTPPRRAPKRKHEEPAEQTPAVVPSTLVAEQEPARKASKTFHSPEAAALPATPLSSSSKDGNMDSDIEDFNSVASSDAFGEDAGSSLGGGKSTNVAERGVAG